MGSYLCVHEGPARISKLGTVAPQAGHDPQQRAGLLQARQLRNPDREPGRGGGTGKPEGGDRELLGFRTLTLCPIDRRLIVPELLTADERSWLDAYHARVRTELRPLMGDATDWLDVATAPLA